MIGPPWPIFDQIVRPDFPEHQLKSEGLCCHAETFIDRCSMAQHPTKGPIRRSITQGLLT